MKYKNLLAAMIIKGITKKDLSELLGKSVKTINNRLSGKHDFNISETKLIMKNYFNDHSAEYLFFDNI